VLVVLPRRRSSMMKIVPTKPTLILVRDRPLITFATSRDPYDRLRQGDDGVVGMDLGSPNIALMALWRVEFVVGNVKSLRLDHVPWIMVQLRMLQMYTKIETNSYVFYCKRTHEMWNVYLSVCYIFLDFLDVT
jgi:hypothetical protein